MTNSLFRCKNISVTHYLALLLLACLLSLVLTTKANAVSINPPSCSTMRETSERPLATKIKSISSEQSTIQIQCYRDGDLSTSSIAVKDSELKTVLPTFQKDDQVILRFGQDSELQSVSIATYKIPWLARIVTIVSVFGSLLIIFLLLLRSSLQHLIVGEDNRFSNSKTQIVIWFFILITTYFASIVLRGFYGGVSFVGGVSIPQNLLVLSGLSAFTYAAAKGITQSKLDDPEMQEQRVLKDREKHSPKFPDDLFRDDNGLVDLGDFQMIVVTLIAVVVYLAETLGFLGTIELYKVVSLPDVDTTILSTFGLGQGAYLIKKFVGDLSK